MNNVRFEELMERKLGDGLSAAELRELEAIIARDPVLREEHDLLLRTSRLLAELAPVEPPPDLKESIMRQVAAVPVATHRKASFASRAGSAIRAAFDLHRRPVLKVGFAAGCVAAAALVITVLNRPVDPVMVSGAMMPRLSDLVITDQVEITQDGTAGLARVETDSGVVVLTIDLLSPDEMGVTISYPVRDLAVKDVAASDGGAVTAVSGPGQIRLAHRGSRRITLVFSDLSPEEPPLHVQVGSGTPYYLATGRSGR